MILCSVPADGHGNDDRLPAGIEDFSGGWDPPGYQHPQGAHGHKYCAHQRVGIVIVLCTERRDAGFIHWTKYNLEIAK